MLNADQAGHWYKCKNPTCPHRVPLPDRLFFGHYDEAFEADCKCGHADFYKYSDAQNETKKWEVDEYFGVKDPRVKFNAFWEE